MDSNYVKIFTGSFIIAQHVVNNLTEIGINAVIKDDTESARLGGFGGGIVPGFQEVYVNKDEMDKAISVVEDITSNLKD